MRARQSLPLLWLLSDARNDSALEAALNALPPGSGFVFRHYHLDSGNRAARFRALAEIARGCGLMVICAAEARVAREWGADGFYGDCAKWGERCGLLRLAAVHDGVGLGEAKRRDADGIFLSPVFPTRSHPGSDTLGIFGFHVLTQQSPIPVIALGGMTVARASELAWPRWGAIDGLASAHTP